MIGGLTPLPEDKRDFELGAIFRLPEIKELPLAFELPVFSIKNQGGTDFCTAYASCGMSEIQEGVELFPAYSFALSKFISGNTDEWGQNMRTALKAHQKYGAIALEEVEDSVKTLSDADLRRFESYPGDYLLKARKHLKKSYFTVTGQHDHYDNIRAAIWKFKEQKQAVAFGLTFGWPANQYILDDMPARGYGHMMFFTGWNEIGLITINSYGIGAGKNGKHAITREVVNGIGPDRGTMMMVDMPPEKAKEMIRSSLVIKISEQTWKQWFRGWFKWFFSEIFK